MITLSVDPHPGSHTVVALEPNGATLASITVPNTPDGLCQLHQFAIPFASRRWRSKERAIILWRFRLRAS
jgi:hypothetical protein